MAGLAAIVDPGQDSGDLGGFLLRCGRTADRPGDLWSEDGSLLQTTVKCVHRNRQQRIWSVTLSLQTLDLA